MGFFEVFQGLIVEMENLESKISRLSVEERGEIREYSMRLLDYAKEDLKSSETLYEKGLFPHAIYHLQQAVEKCAKSAGVSTYQITISECRQIGHETPQVFIKLLRNFYSFINLGKLYGLDADLLEVESLVRNQGRAFASLSGKDIKTYLQVSDRAASVFLSLIPHNLRMFAGTLAELYILSFITFPHHVVPRYPDYPLKLEDYNENLGIVECYHELSRRIDGCITSVRKFIEQKWT